ncbi:hypothetical protein [Blastococcus sp. SYSU DS0539]
MWVEFTISHEAAAETLAPRLERVFGPSQPAALSRSAIFGPNAAAWQSQLQYCGESQQSRIICYAAKSNELQVVIEPTGGRLDRIFQSAWDGITTALADLGPVLTDAKQVDEATNQTIQSGQVGVAAEIRQKEIYLPLSLALANVAWLGVGLLTWVDQDQLRFMSGSVTTVTAGVFAAGSLFLNLRKKRLRWSGTQ